MIRRPPRSTPLYSSAASDVYKRQGWFHAGWSSAAVVAPAFLTLIFREVYPSYLLTFNHAVTELGTRGSAYFFLLTDDYPSIERNPNIAVIFPDIEGGKKLNRYLPLVKWLLAIPLYIVGIIYIFLSIIVTFLAWIITSATGNYPEWAAKIVCLLYTSPSPRDS